MAADEGGRLSSSNPDGASAVNLLRIFRRKINPARELAMIGHEKRRSDKKAVARRIREELGLAPDRRLAG